MKVTVEPEVVQTELVDVSMLNVTGAPEPPPVAVTLYVGPAITAGLGAVDVKLIVCASRAAAGEVNPTQLASAAAKSVAAAAIDLRGRRATWGSIRRPPVGPGSPNTVLSRW